MSKIFSKPALNALNRIGDIIAPKNGELPSYSECGCIEYIDDVAGYAPENDIKDLNMLLTVLSFMPGFVLQLLIKTINNSHQKDGPLTDLFRMLDFGLKGIILGTYYSGKVGKDYKGKSPQQIIGFNINRMEA